MKTCHFSCFNLTHNLSFYLGINMTVFKIRLWLINLVFVLICLMLTPHFFQTYNWELQVVTHLWSINIDTNLELSKVMFKYTVSTWKHLRLLYDLCVNMLPILLICAKLYIALSKWVCISFIIKTTRLNNR